MEPAKRSDLREADFLCGTFLFMSQKVVVVTPLYNDWDCLAFLLPQLKAVWAAHNAAATIGSRPEFELQAVVVVNDCSSQSADFSAWHTETDLRLVHLNRNVGHQKAISLGLSYTYDNLAADWVAVMDVDGEDKPEHIPLLLRAAAATAGNCIVFSSRSERSEGVSFRFFYQIYKLLFRVLTGKRISFGNFCVIPGAILYKLIYSPYISHHFSGGAIKAKVPLQTLPLERGSRLAGVSKMNFVSLVMHGLNAVAVHIDTVSIRLLLFAVTIIGLLMLSLVVVVAVKLFTPLAIPGWATYVGLALLSIALQAFLLCVTLVFNILSYNRNKEFTPILDYQDYVYQVTEINNK